MCELDGFLRFLTHLMVVSDPRPAHFLSFFSVHLFYIYDFFVRALFFLLRVKKYFFVRFAIFFANTPTFLAV